MANKPASLSSFLVRKGEAAPSAVSLPHPPNLPPVITSQPAIASNPVNQTLEAPPVVAAPLPAPMPVVSEAPPPAAAPSPLEASPVVQVAPAPLPSPAPQAPVIQLAPPTTLLSEDSVAKQKAMTVKLDYQRFVMIKQLGLKQNQSSQDIFVEALDDYFRKKGML